jgi:hypothetical protein
MGSTSHIDQNNPNPRIALCTQTHGLDIEMQIKRCSIWEGEAVNLSQAVPRCSARWRRREKSWVMQGVVCAIVRDKGQKYPPKTFFFPSNFLFFPKTFYFFFIY